MTSSTTSASRYGPLKFFAKQQLTNVYTVHVHAVCTCMHIHVHVHVCVYLLCAYVRVCVCVSFPHLSYHAASFSDRKEHTVIHMCITALHVHVHEQSST